MPVPLLPQETLNFPVDVGIRQSDFLDFICLNLVSREGNVDETPENNSDCLAIEQEFTVNTPYPNPCCGNDNQLILEMILPEAGDVEMLMISATGSIVREDNVSNAPEGFNQFSLNLSILEPGIYLMKIVYDGQERIERVVIQ